MAFTDAVLRTFREFVRYTGDGLPGEPTNAPLPIGDPRSGTHNPSKKEVRDTLTAVSDSIDAATAAAIAAEAAAEAAAGLVSDAVSQGNVPIYATSQGISLVDVPSGLTALYTNGYSAPGDGGGAFWLAVGSAPSHPGKIQDSAGGWYELAVAEPTVQMFGAKGDGTTNDYTAIVAAAGYVAAKGGVLTFPRGTYRISSNLTLSVPFRFLAGAKVKPDTNVRFSPQAFGEQAPGGSAIDLSAGGVTTFTRQWLPSLRISRFLTSPDAASDQAAAVREALIELFASPGYNTLDLEGRIINLASNVVLVAGENGMAGDIHASYQREKRIINGRLRWAGAASPSQTSDFMISIEAPALNSGRLFSGLGWSNVVFDAGGVAKNLYRIAGYYEHDMDRCRFLDYGAACAVFLDDYDNDGAYVSGNGAHFVNCRWRGLEFGAAPLGCSLRAYPGDTIIEGGNVDSTGGFDIHTAPLTAQNVHFSFVSGLAAMTQAITLRDPRETIIANNDMDNCGVLITNEGHAAHLAQNAKTNWRGIHIVGNKVALNDDPATGYGWVTLSTNQAGTVVNGLSMGPNPFVPFTGSGLDGVAEFATRTPSGGSFSYGQCSGIYVSSGAYGGRPAGGQFGPGGTTAFPFTFISEAEVRALLFAFSGDANVGGGISSDGAGGMYLRANGAAGWRLVSNQNLMPVADNLRNLGGPSNRCSTIYAGTGTINTSDAREKSLIGDIPDLWLDAWGDVRWRRFKMNDAMEIKGDDARWHIGLVAQQVKEAFEAREIDAFAIGLLCYDEWPEQELVKAPDGEVLQASRPAGDRYGLRYEECLALESAWLRREISRISA